MKILALETSAKAVSVALIEDGIILASAYQNTGLTHSRTLMPMVEGMLANAEIPKTAVAAIAVAQGPGSFTGIRIGVSAAKGLAFALNIPAVGVSTLEAMAQNLTHCDGTIVCAMDARRSQVYNAIFTVKDNTFTRNCDDRAIALADLAAELQATPTPIYIVGDGGKLAYDYLTDQGLSVILAPPHLQMQQAIGVGLCAQQALANGDAGDSAALTPNYLRLSQAERERNERLKKETTQ
ncbi:tRNA (adenosine(37)-N6)-threonylcarbamoyltransferase complex dimerization subunit type 1 TsaB [Bengtsoniella intestinalis]|uniref:tRNA (adenosine(37)-N6)-threonylcarbamoyltransferase complex dimerization subunit type 1 TsaB n=1 Tax=Bengtsoniella intestinalis TaxID=3073143 RepID=UPI00391F73B4